MRWPRVLCALALGACVSAASAHTLYVANDNHTDYGWNATTAAYDATMLAELDYYLSRIGATASRPSDEQARFNADCWWYLYLYEHHRTASQFQALVTAMQTGHIQVPLKVSVGAKDGSYPLGPADLPLRATVVLGGAAAGADGECGEVAFAPSQCRVASRGTLLLCK